MDFPSDLRDAQNELDEVRAELNTLYKALPWSVVELPGWSRERETGGSYYASERPDSPGWTTAEQEMEAELRARRLDLAERIVTHPFWASCDDAPAARSLLKHINEQPEPT
ncbi:hypothetical protein ACFC0M_05960 [Streptomyces sp. NPDC056149]|uniref:hypothetical protein n=1 Tax=Streptomyces sp. NPDC056149 TaxID=3345728 RepID=UPI0035D94007